MHKYKIKSCEKVENGSVVRILENYRLVTCCVKKYLLLILVTPQCPYLYTLKRDLTEKSV